MVVEKLNLFLEAAGVGWDPESNEVFGSSKSENITLHRMNLFLNGKQMIERLSNMKSKLFLKA